MTIPPVILHVPRPPSLNKLWRHIPGKGRVKSTEYIEWLNRAGWLVKIEAMGIPPIDCRYDMTIEVPISWRDTGNWEKPIGDLLERIGVVTNDGNVNELTVRPVERDDCAVIMTLRPDLGNIRKRRAPRGLGKPTYASKKPSAKRLAKVAAVRARIPF